MEQTESAASQVDAQDVPVNTDKSSEAHDAVTGGYRRPAVRHRKTSTLILKQWFAAHMEWPFPDQAEKERLGIETCMSVKQVATWFTNTRRRNGAKLAQCGIPSSTRTPPPKSGAWPAPSLSNAGADDSTDLSAVNIVASYHEPSGMTPFDRWRHSPPQDEPVSMEVIADAAKRTPDAFFATASNGDKSAAERPPPPASLSSLVFSSSSASCSSSAFSNNSASASNSVGSAGSGDLSTWRRGRRRKSKLTRYRSGRPVENRDDGKRPYQCTFCTDSFKSRYDWTRHEASLHLVLDKWTCLALGPRGCDPAGDTMHCVLCGAADPTDEHLASHRVANCTSKPPGTRTFLRKDHLRQHLRFAHGVDGLTKWMDAWRSKELNVKSRCGFCAAKFTTWPDRNDHLADHFRAGTLMKDWTGCRGLEPSVALLVENAIPPYLIGLEADPDPFSASKGSTKRVMEMTGGAEACEGRQQAPRAPTSFESLTARLGDYVRIARENSLDLTDDALRRQARLILYDDDDPWNHTPADNPQWLNMFKSGYGLSNPGLSRQVGSEQPVVAGLDDAEAAGRDDKEASPFTWERLRHAVGPDAAMLQFHLGDMTSDGAMPSMPGPGVLVPWSWQTPECLAEFSQLCTGTGSSMPCEVTDGGFGIDPTLLGNSTCEGKEELFGLDGTAQWPASGSLDMDALVDEAIMDVPTWFDSELT